MPPAERGRREKLRLRAAGWFAEGVSQAEVARRSGVSPQPVSVWHRAWVDGGADALRSAGPPGAHRGASDEGFAEVAAVLEAGPEAAGFTGQIWTLARVGRVITGAPASPLANLGAAPSTNSSPSPANTSDTTPRSSTDSSQQPT
ncbi:helix-turn-helix domain-containing protein [Embleya scabrispora]|uniref:helix-turn-helix domain-containing protein n=1 Tax=Embleya scabrispora TaxID=159449 RepID=UPI0003A95135|nr:helix-turn-helix domain-containing protein [Embleya scabrispora]MYS84042.1 helix-turn-helix domain-containing protein [Streptomyces sp. SID5474]